jgi:hypothetical protein
MTVTTIPRIDLGLGGALTMLARAIRYVERQPAGPERDRAASCAKTLFASAMGKLLALEDIAGVALLAGPSERLTRLRVRACEIGILDAADIARIEAHTVACRPPAGENESQPASCEAPQESPPRGAPASEDDRPWAIVELHLSTPIADDGRAVNDLARHLEAQAELAPRRVEGIRKLTDAGWSMARPAVLLDEPKPFLSRLAAEVARLDRDESVSEPLLADGHLDLDIRFRKQFASSDDALEEVAHLALHDGSDNWDFAWNEQPNGDVEWWDEIPGGV